jgi:hypothetical protein
MHLSTNLIIYFVFSHPTPSLNYIQQERGTQETVKRWMCATKSDSKKGVPWGIACVQFGSEEKLKLAIAADEAVVVTRHNKRFVQWESFDDSICQGLERGFIATSSKAVSKETYKQITDNLKDAGLSIDLPQKDIKDWNGGKVDMPDKAKEVLKKASMACVKTITECRDIFKELQKSEKSDTETGKTLQNRLRMEWEAVAAAKNLVDDMVTYETAPDGKKLDYNLAITEMNKIAATLEGAFDAVSMTKVHVGLNRDNKEE